MKKSHELRVDYEKKNDGVRVHRKKKRWGECLP